MALLAAEAVGVLSTSAMLCSGSARGARANGITEATWSREVAGVKGREVTR